MGATHRRIEFAGAPAGRGPATWGQRTTWADVVFFTETQWWAVLKRQAVVPAGLDMDGVLAAVAELVVRHGALRTRFSEEDGTLMQEAAAGGVIEADVIEASADTLAAVLDEHRLGLMSRPFDHAAEFPVRVAVGVVDDAPRAVLLAVSHVVADLGSVNFLKAELEGLLAAGADGRPAPPPVPAWQPVELAEAEQGERGQRADAAAAEHLRRQLEAIPASMFRPAEPGPSPRFRTATLISPSAAAAMRKAAARRPEGVSSILFAATCALLRELTGTASCTMWLIYSNRADRMLRNAVGNLSQTVLATVEVGDTSFDALLAGVGAATMRAYRRGWHDPGSRAAVVADVEAARGVALDLGCRFNDMWTVNARLSAPDGAAAGTGAEAAPGPSRLRWDEGYDQDKLTFFVEVGGPPETMHLKVIADTHRVPADAIPAFLYGLEGALVALAEGEPSVADVRARLYAGQRP